MFKVRSGRARHGRQFHQVPNRLGDHVHARDARHAVEEVRAVPLVERPVAAQPGLVAGERMSHRLADLLARPAAVPHAHLAQRTDERNATRVAVPILHRRRSDAERHVRRQVGVVHRLRHGHEPVRVDREVVAVARERHMRPLTDHQFVRGDHMSARGISHEETWLVFVGREEETPGVPAVLIKYPAFAAVRARRPRPRLDRET